MRARSTYHDLVIVALDPASNVWLGDDNGHLVQMEIGEIHSQGECNRYANERHFPHPERR